MPPKANPTPRKTVAKRAADDSMPAPPAKRVMSSASSTPVPVAGPAPQLKKEESEDVKPQILSTSGNVLLKLKSEEPAINKKGQEKIKLNRHDFAAQKVQILCGTADDQFTFLVSPNLLKRNSEWFSNHSWKTQVLLIPEIKPQNFEIWVTWLHTRDISDADETIIIDKSLSAVELAAIAPKKTKQLVELYAVGIRLECEDFKNYMVSQIIGHIKVLFDRLGPKSQFGLEGHMIYNLTAKVADSDPPVFKDNKLTLAIKDFFFATAAPISDFSSSLCGDCRNGKCPVAMRFFVDLAIMGMELVRTNGKRKVVVPWERDSRYYHEHDDEVHEKSMIKIGKVSR